MHQAMQPAKPLRVRSPLLGVAQDIDTFIDGFEHRVRPLPQDPLFGVVHEVAYRQRETIGDLWNIRLYLSRTLRTNYWSTYDFAGSEGLGFHRHAPIRRLRRPPICST